MRPIDADVYENEIWKLRRNYQLMDDTHTADKIMHGLYRAEQALKDAPTLDVRPVVHGHWIRKWDTHCSACGVGFSEMPYSYDTEDGHGYVEKFCPNCGAIMDEKVQE